MLYLLAFEGISVPVNLGLQGRLADERPRTGRSRGIRGRVCVVPTEIPPRGSGGHFDLRSGAGEPKHD